VISATRGRRPVFAERGCARVVINELRHSDAGGYSKTLAFVVMPDHLHWLFELLGTGNLSGVVNRIKGRSSRAIGLMGMQGHVWQGGFFDHALRRDEDVRAVSRYIVANPLRAGLVEQIGDYPHWDALWLHGDMSEENQYGAGGPSGPKRLYVGGPSGPNRDGQGPSGPAVRA